MSDSYSPDALTLREPISSRISFDSSGAGWISVIAGCSPAYFPSPSGVESGGNNSSRDGGVVGFSSAESSAPMLMDNFGDKKNGSSASGSLRRSRPSIIRPSLMLTMLSCRKWLIANDSALRVSASSFSRLGRTVMKSNCQSVIPSKGRSRLLMTASIRRWNDSITSYHASNCCSGFDILPV